MKPVISPDAPVRVGSDTVLVRVTAIDDEALYFISSYEPTSDQCGSVRRQRRAAPRPRTRSASMVN